jgi:hypothetical protein
MLVKRLNRIHALAAALLLPFAQCALAEKSPWSPDQYFVQVGVAEDAQTVVVGTTWAWRWQHDFDAGRLTGYWETSLGRWSSNPNNAARSSALVTQLGLTPVLRWHPSAWGERWFVEAGIGANVILPVYRSRDKRFSTAFNFGDHVALGYRFGEERQQELALRVQHFSNASIKQPNPGENFLQLRFSRRF